MYRERIVDAAAANDKALEMVYRTEELIYVLLVPKRGADIDNLKPSDTEFMIADGKGVENVIGALLGAFQLDQKETGEYIVRYIDMLPEREETDEHDD